MEKTRKLEDVKQYSKNEIARIQYQCRRGMLELDVFLNSFCSNCFVILSTDQQSCFIKLLKQSDPDLFSWFMGYSESDPEFKSIVRLIQQYQLSTNSD